VSIQPISPISPDPHEQDCSCENCIQDRIDKRLAALRRSAIPPVPSGTGWQWDGYYKMWRRTHPYRPHELEYALDGCIISSTLAQTIIQARHSRRPV
jgi:hypothetical protein